MKTKQTILLTLALLVSTVAFSQVGIGTLMPDPSSILDVKSVEKGFLPPRMTTAERNSINDGVPSQGLVIFNTTENCMQWYNGSSWYNACDGTSSAVIPGLTACASATISATPCSAVSGATLNNDTTTADGIEYDWTGATGFVAGGTTRALVEINGQCWYRRNSDKTPSSFDPSPAYVPGSDVGWSGYYTGGPHANEGLLYQLSAVMNNSHTDRGQGVCAPGFHVPSDCEWMFLEHSLGMDNETLTNINLRGTDGEGTKLKSGGSSGFTALPAGFRISDATGSFFNRATNPGGTGYFWASTPAVTSGDSWRRFVQNGSANVFRQGSNPVNAFSVRCIKD